MKKNDSSNISSINIGEILTRLNVKKDYLYYSQKAHNIDEQKQIIENIETSIQLLSQLYPTRHTIEVLEDTKKILELEKSKMEMYCHKINNKFNYFYNENK